MFEFIIWIYILIIFQEYWTSRAILQFQKLCGLKPLVGVVDEYVDGILNIFLCDTSSNEDIYFHHVLRTEGHAIVCRENVPSKVSSLDVFYNVFYLISTLRGIREFKTEGYSIYSLIFETSVRFLSS